MFPEASEKEPSPLGPPAQWGAHPCVLADCETLLPQGSLPPTSLPLSRVCGLSFPFSPSGFVLSQTGHFLFHASELIKMEGTAGALPHERDKGRDEVAK